MKYRKLPVVIDAFQFGIGPTEAIEKWAVEAVEKGVIKIIVTGNELTALIITPEGDMIAKKGDYIIRGINGEIYPCKSDIFEKTYEVVESNGLAECCETCKNYKRELKYPTDPLDEDDVDLYLHKCKKHLYDLRTDHLSDFASDKMQCDEWEAK